MINLREAEKRTYSQNGEDGVLRAIFDELGETNRYFVEIGSGDENKWVDPNYKKLHPGQNNTRALWHQGWTGLWIDKRGGKVVKPHHVTAENICHILRRYGAPKEFDLLSLDIDGVDWWVLKAVLTQYKPRVMICETNPNRSASEAVTVFYRANFKKNYDDYWGASLLAFELLARSRGLALVHVESYGINAIFVPEGDVERFGVPLLDPPDVAAHWLPPHHHPDRPWGPGCKPSGIPMIPIPSLGGKRGPT